MGNNQVSNIINLTQTENRLLYSSSKPAHLSSNSPIGIFDSGVGGTYIANAISHLLPSEDIIYFGDTANTPWGDKSSEQIINFSGKICDFLSSTLNCKIIVIACNTATAVATKALIEKVKQVNKNIQIVNVIDPVVEYVTKKYNNCNVGLIGTTQTINSNYYINKINELQPSISVKALATPLLAPLIEKGDIYSNTINSTLEKYLTPFLSYNLKTFILGCTHYPIIKNLIKDFFYKHNNHNDIEIIDAGALTASKVEFLLNTINIKSQKKISQKHFFVSKNNDFFNQSILNLFPKDVVIQTLKLD